MAMNRPRIVSQAEWRGARKALLAEEKEFTRQRDTLNAERRRLPMVRVDKDYVFESPHGPARLVDLFEGRQQLIVYHFMFDPSWDAGCPSCSFLTDNIGLLAHLHARRTTLALVSRAPLAKLESVSKAHGLDDSLVFVVRQRLQLRLPRDDGRARGAGRIPLHGRDDAAGERRSLFHRR